MTVRFRNRLTKLSLLLMLVPTGAMIAWDVYWCKSPASRRVTASVKTPSLLFELGDSRSLLSGLFTPSHVDLTLLTDCEVTEDAPDKSLTNTIHGGKRFVNVVLTGMDVSEGIRTALDVTGGALQVKLEPTDSNRAVDPLDFQAPVCLDMQKPCPATGHLAHFTARPSGGRYLEFAMRFHEQPERERNIPLKNGSLISFDDGPERVFLLDALLRLNGLRVPNVRGLTLGRVDGGVLQISLHFADRETQKAKGDLMADYLLLDVTTNTNQVRVSNVPGGDERNVAPSHFQDLSPWAHKSSAAIASLASTCTALAGLFQLFEKLRRKRRLAAQSSSSHMQGVSTK